MNKNTICALLLGTSILSCDTPTETRSGGSKVLYIPADCKEIVSLQSGPYWQLTCKDETGKEVFYHKSHTKDPWQKYQIIRQ